MQRIPFFQAVASDARQNIRWLESEVARLAETVPGHAALIARLRNLLDEARAKLSDLEMLTEIGDARLCQHMLPIAHQLEFLLGVVGTTYLPVLQRQGNGERITRGLLFAVAQNMGIAWLQDVAARLDGVHAAYVAMPDFPIIYAPPRHEVSIVDVPGLYHEMGHAVFARHNDELAGQLAAAVRAHSPAQLDLLNPESQTAESDGTHSERRWTAESYWTSERLAELFCDVLATIVCGPAHYASLVDIALRHHRSPFEMKHGGHPPMSARVRASYLALPDEQRERELVRRMHDAWTEHEADYPRSPGFCGACDESLIDALVARITELVNRVLPECVRCQLPTEKPSQMREIAPDASLETILNQAATIFFLHPADYPAWEAGAIARCRMIADAALAARDATHRDGYSMARPDPAVMRDRRIVRA